MLGVPSQTSYKSISDFQNSSDYLNYLYNKANGYGFRCRINSSNGYFSKHEFEVNGSYSDFSSNLENVYVSMNTFRKLKPFSTVARDSAHLKRINAFYVDIDCYKANISQNEAISILHEEYIGTKVPHPTFIIKSGRGIYCIWKLDNEDFKAITRWQVVQNYLIDALRPLGADGACSDSSRILRIPFSINSKSNTMVEIVEFNDLVYTIHSISSEYGANYSDMKKKKNAEKKVTLNQRKAVEGIVRSLGVEPPNLSNYSETYLWLADYRDYISDFTEKRRKLANPFLKTPKIRDSVKPCSDFHFVLKRWSDEIETLAKMRHGKEHHRENMLFLYRLWNLELTNDPNLALERVLSLNSTFSTPLNEKLVIKATESAERKFLKGATYSFGIRKIVDFLQVDDDELLGLAFFSQALANVDTRTLTTGKARNRKAVNHTYYKKKIENNGETLKADKISLRRKEISSLLQYGFSHAEIMKKMSISRATFYRDLAFVSDVNKIVASVSDKLSVSYDDLLKAVKELRECKCLSSESLLNFLVSKIKSITYKKNYFVVLSALCSLNINLFYALFRLFFTSHTWDFDG